MQTEHNEQYLAGVALFNQRDYFEAHEVWEDLWVEVTGLEHRFLQGLIQAAVGLCHFHNGNVKGAIKLYHSARNYLQQCGAECMGLDVEEFLQQHERCHAELLASAHPTRALEPDPSRLPEITLVPAPERWPDVSQYLEDADPSGESE